MLYVTISLVFEPDCVFVFHPQIENYLYRNHETRKYLQEQAYRLQQGIVTTTTQQVRDTTHSNDSWTISCSLSDEAVIFDTIKSILTNEMLYKWFICLETYCNVTEEVEFWTLVIVATYYGYNKQLYLPLTWHIFWVFKFLFPRWSTGFAWRCRTTWTLWGTLRQTPSWKTSGQQKASSKTRGTLKRWGDTHGLENTTSDWTEPWKLL